MEGNENPLESAAEKTPEQTPALEQKPEAPKAPPENIAEKPAAKTPEAKESRERITEKMLFASFKGYMDNKRAVEGITGNDALKEARGSQTEAARKAHNEMIAEWAQQHLGVLAKEQGEIVMLEKAALIEKKYIESQNAKPEEASALKSAYRWYARQPLAYRTAISAAIATGVVASIVPASIGLAVGGLSGGLAIAGTRRFVGGMATAAITGFVASHVDKIPAVKRWLETKHKKDYEKIAATSKEAQEKMTLANIRTVVAELSAQTEAAEERAGKREERLRFWTGVGAGVLTGLVVGGVGRAVETSLTAESLSGIPAAPHIEVPPQAPEIPPSPELAPSVIIGEGGNLWKAAKAFGLSNQEFAHAWRDSTVVIDGKEIPISKVGLVHPGATVTWDAEHGIFKVQGENMNWTESGYLKRPPVSAAEAPRAPETPPTPGSEPWQKAWKADAGEEYQAMTETMEKISGMNPADYERIKNDNFGGFEPQTEAQSAFLEHINEKIRAAGLNPEDFRHNTMDDVLKSLAYGETTPKTAFLGFEMLNPLDRAILNELAQESVSMKENLYSMIKNHSFGELAEKRSPSFRWSAPEPLKGVSPLFADSAAETRLYRFITDNLKNLNQDPDIFKKETIQYALRHIEDAKLKTGHVLESAAQNAGSHAPSGPSSHLGFTTPGDTNVDVGSTLEAAKIADEVAKKLIR